MQCEIYHVIYWTFLDNFWKFMKHCSIVPIRGYITFFMTRKTGMRSLKPRAYASSYNSKVTLLRCESEVKVAVCRSSSLHAYAGLRTSHWQLQSPKALYEHPPKNAGQPLGKRCRPSSLMVAHTLAFPPHAAGRTIMAPARNNVRTLSSLHRKQQEPHRSERRAHEGRNG